MTSDYDAEAVEVRLVLEAIHARYGYDFRDYQFPSIRRRVLAALAKSGLRHLGDLQHEILTSPASCASIVDELTIGVTGMFRDPEFYRLMRSRMVPVLRTYPQLKIWHAGCASGEEIYSVAILLQEEGLHERSQIYATDVSVAALERARSGVYPEASLEAFAGAYRAAGGAGRFDNYCSAGYGRIVMHEALRRNIVFFQHDLATDYALGEMHVILCRNVLMYFADPLRARVLSMFGRGLVHGGFLCLGNSERLLHGAPDFTEFAASQRIYRKRGEA